MKKSSKSKLLIDAKEDTLPRPSAQGLGMLHDYIEGVRKYQAFLKTTAEGDFEGYNVVLDTANGASYTSARAVFADLKANLTVIGENLMDLISMLKLVQLILKRWLKSCRNRK